MKQVDTAYHFYFIVLRESSYLANLISLRLKALHHSNSLHGLHLIWRRTLDLRIPFHSKQIHRARYPGLLWS